MLRHLSANAKYTDPQVVNRVFELCQEEITLKALQEQLPDEDPVIIRTAVYALLHKGKLVSKDMMDSRLSLLTSVRAA